MCSCWSPVGRSLKPVTVPRSSLLWSTLYPTLVTMWILTVPERAFKIKLIISIIGPETHNLHYIVLWIY